MSGISMRYDVRYQIAGEEKSQEVDARNAAEAAAEVQEQFVTSGDVFELIQVTLIDEFDESTEHIEQSVASN